VVDRFGKAAGRPDAFELGRYLGHADSEWDRDVRGQGEGQRIARADGIGIGVDNDKCGAQRIDDHVDEPCCSEERNCL
jgi:hypothetical protein